MPPPWPHQYTTETSIAATTKPNEIPVSRMLSTEMEEKNNDERKIVLKEDKEEEEYDSTTKRPLHYLVWYYPLIKSWIWGTT